MAEVDKSKDILDLDKNNYSIGGCIEAFDQKINVVFNRFNVSESPTEELINTDVVPEGSDSIHGHSKDSDRDLNSLNGESIKSGSSFLIQGLITFTSVVIHLLIINSFFYVLTGDTYATPALIFCCNFFWIISILSINFYSLKRTIKFETHLIKFIQYYLIFCLTYLSILSLERQDFLPFYHISLLGVLLLLLLIYRKLFFFIRLTYKLETGKITKVVLVGKDGNFENILKAFEKDNLRLSLLGYFQNGEDYTSNHLGAIKDIFTYIESQPVDEIYCAVSQLSEFDLKKIIEFADNNFIKIKLIPDYKNNFGRAMEVENFNSIPIINFRKSPLDNDIAKFGKRFFDLIFSTLVISLILTWLIPLLFILNLFGSRGPVLFKQLRHGYNKKPFWCYKFRSMKMNEEANLKMCTKNDPRITKIGKFLRNSSIDELPQFINVFLGHMSVVGPRPHMKLHTFLFQKNVNRYLLRHLIKPGITGLAQVKGYRGEIVHPADIINRTRLDIFYLEKWSPLLDLKIIYETVHNALKGERKAY